jgi:ABC-type polysaccharide/polyol phosphate export permease
VTGVREQYDSSRRAHPMIAELAALLRYRDVLVQLVGRNLKVRYKRSVLGFAWSMLAPLLTMATLSLVFTQVFRPTAPNYPLYLFPGLLLWGFFSQTTSSITAEVIGGVELWRRIFTPRTAFAIATTATGLVHLCAALVPLAVLMLVTAAPISLALVAVPIAVLCTAMFALGVGLAVASVAGHFADVGDLFQVVLGTWMYFTPIIYPREILPDAYHWVWRLNPMAHFVEAFRLPIYEAQMPSAGLLATIVAMACVALVCGWWLFTRTVDDLARRG